MNFISSLFIGLLILSGIPVAHSSEKSQLYDLQEKCGIRAEQLYANEFAQTLLDQSDQGDQGESGFYNYVNHYNVKLNRCYMLVSSKPNPNEDTGLNVAIQLIDVNEHNAFAFYSAGSNDKELTECFVQDKQCHSLDEWKKLIKPFMEE